MAAHRVPASRRLDWFVSDLVGATVGVTGERNVKSWRYSEPILCASGRFTRAEYPFIWLAFEKPSVTLIELAVRRHPDFSTRLILHNADGEHIDNVSAILNRYCRFRYRFSKEYTYIPEISDYR